MTCGVGGGFRRDCPVSLLPLRFFHPPARPPAPPTTADFHQQLPLMYADFHGHAEVYKLLKEHKKTKGAAAAPVKAENRVCAECTVA